MTPDQQRAHIEAFHRALRSQDYDAIESYLADDVVWNIGGPVDVLPFCGSYRGKATVRNMLEFKIAKTLGKRRIEPDMFLIDGNRGAILGRIIGSLPGGQSISYRIAQFFTFSGGKVVEHFSVLDSFDAAEQVMGQRIAVSVSPAREPAGDNLVAV
jgi:ketosteroid isomerase-like protein